jgi:hypothetical protein
MRTRDAICTKKQPPNQLFRPSAKKSMVPWLERMRGKVRERGYPTRDALKTGLVRMGRILGLIHTIKKKAHGPISLSSKAGNSTGRKGGRFKKSKTPRKKLDPSRSSTSGRTKTTKKDNYGGMTGPRTGPQKQDHGLQHLNLPLGTQEETQDSSNPEDGNASSSDREDGARARQRLPEEKG